MVPARSAASVLHIFMQCAHQEQDIAWKYVFIALYLWTGCGFETTIFHIILGLNCLILFFELACSNDACFFFPSIFI